ncbi:hypothetical protein M426DRAFT_24692 [Hypoxylon sp. CI-4A]|nr:hypothetical protein M426DRAFT_24692 [Hypoxylon sp. CI-4A]
MVHAFRAVCAQFCQAVLHAASVYLHVAFAWASSHSFDFAVVNPDYDPAEEEEDAADLYQYRMMMSSMGQSPDPAMPQEYLFRATDPTPETPFANVDRMHQGSRTHPRTVERKADKYKLYQLFDDPVYQGKQITYTYDFGDNWDHFLTMQGRAEATDKFVCVDGGGHEVAEDVGGSGGWAALKAAYRTDTPTQEQLDKRDWYENDCSNGNMLGLEGDYVNEWNDLWVKDNLEPEMMDYKFGRRMRR